jgi:ABC-type amino acid transport substrate-binding protein
MAGHMVGFLQVTSIVLVIVSCSVTAQKESAANTSGSPTWRAGRIPFFEEQDVITVCGSPWTSAVECDLDANEENWVEATGYEIEVFKLAMPIVGWTDEMIKFECLGWGDMMDRLENGTCNIAPSGMAPLTERMDLGLKFSDHTLQSGIAVMVRAQEEDMRSIWYFFSAMSWEVWVALLATAFLAGGIVWLMEVGSKALNNETRYLNNVMWDTVGRPVQMRDYRVASIAGNTVAWVWSFTAFIVMALFQASLTTNMTLQSINGKLASFDDLQGRVGTSCARPSCVCTP